MPSSRTRSRGAARFLSRKQQWRIACGAGSRRPRTRTPNEGETTINGWGTEGLGGQGTLRSAVHAGPELGSPAGSRGISKSSPPPPPPPLPPLPPPLHQPSQPSRSLLSPRRTSISRNVGSAGRIVDSKGKRRVCFDSRIQVVLVPTRHELKSKLLGDEGAGEERQEVDSDDNGIWWTVRDCFAFRRGYRRQIIASGLKCRSLLCPTDVVFLIGAEDDDENVGEADKRSCDASQVDTARDVASAAASCAVAA